jgi:hypothetical protein
MALVALGTIGAVLVALFGSPLRAKFFPPVFEFNILKLTGEPCPVKNAQQQHVADSRYYHLNVRNKRGWVPATHSQLRLIRVSGPRSSAPPASLGLYNSLHRRQGPPNGTYGIFGLQNYNFSKLFIINMIIEFYQPKISRFHNLCSIMKQRVKIAPFQHFGVFATRRALFLRTHPQPRNLCATRSAPYDGSHVDWFSDLGVLPLPGTSLITLTGQRVV